MVKGISKQVIVVHSPDPKLFEQAIFILKEDAVRNGFSEESLLKEAQQAVKNNSSQSKIRRRNRSRAIWIGIGAIAASTIWGFVSWLL